MTTLTQQTQEAAHEHSYGNLLYASHHAGFIACAQWERDREKWIKVEDQLPEDYTEVLAGAFDEDGDFQSWVCNYSERCFTIQATGNSEIIITHWQPMPQPPKS